MLSAADDVHDPVRSVEVREALWEQSFTASQISGSTSQQLPVGHMELASPVVAWPLK